MPVARSVTAKFRRIALLKKLSPRGICAGCGARHAVAELEVDHVRGRLYESNRMDSLARVERYEAELAAGIELRAVCRSCSARQGGMRYRHGGGGRVAARSSATAAPARHSC